MAERKSSCLKRLALGCGVLVGLVVLVVALGLIGLALNQPEPTDFTTLQTSDAVAQVNREGGLNLPDSPASQKPVRLSFDVSMLRFEILPGSDNGKIEIDSEYDRANFSLETEVVEKDDHIDYRLKFKNKRSLLGMIFGAGTGKMEDVENKVRVRLPTNLLYDLNLHMRMGEADLELGGLAMREMDVDMSMGEMNIGMREANAVAMENARLKASMGETHVYDFQNFGFAKGEFRGRMGELHLYNSGPLRQDTQIHARMSMGEIRIQAPENAIVDASAGAFMGGYSGPRNRGQSDDPNAPELTVRGGVTMGEMRVSKGTRKMQPERVEPMVAFERIMASPTGEIDLDRFELNQFGYRLLRQNHIQEAIEIFKLNLALHPEYANGYDSLGEAYLEAGDKEQAIANYEKALQMDPDNDRIKRVLGRLRN